MADGNIIKPALSQRSPLGELLYLALPTVAQMASYTVMQFADTLQLAMGAGDVPAAAAGLAGFMVFCAMSWAFGAIMCVNTLVSQSVGAGQGTLAGRYLWQGVWFGLFAGAVLLPTQWLAGPALRALGHTPELVSNATLYYNIEVKALPLRLASMAIGQFLLAIGRPRITLLAAVVAVVIDIAMNFVLITGRYGFPRMGVAGAAWSTNAAVCLELLILCLFAAKANIRLPYAVTHWRLHWDSMTQLVKIGIPSGIQVTSEVFAWFLFCGWIMNHFGETAITANNYMMQYMKLSFMPAFGLSAAVTALVGRYVGMGEPAIAKRRAHLGYVVATIYMIGCGISFFAFRYQLLRLFTNDPAIIEVGATLLLFAAIYQLFDSTYIIYIGALRGAGDTNVPAWITAVLCWSIVVAGGTAMSYLLPQLGPTGPWLAACVYGVILGLFLVIRFIRGNWKSIVPPADRPTIAFEALSNPSESSTKLTTIG